MNKLKEQLDAKGLNAHKASIACGYAPSTVTRHLAAERVPAEACVVYERCLGIPRESLRPDLYGDRRPAAAVQEQEHAA